jgi:hypothetical protein
MQRFNAALAAAAATAAAEKEDWIMLDQSEASMPSNPPPHTSQYNQNLQEKLNTVEVGLHTSTPCHPTHILPVIATSYDDFHYFLTNWLQAILKNLLGAW